MTSCNIISLTSAGNKARKSLVACMWRTCAHRFFLSLCKQKSGTYYKKNHPIFKTLLITNVCLIYIENIRYNKFLLAYAEIGRLIPCFNYFYFMHAAKQQKSIWLLNRRFSACFYLRFVDVDPLSPDSS